MSLFTPITNIRLGGSTSVAPDNQSTYITELDAQKRSCSQLKQVLQAMVEFNNSTGCVLNCIKSSDKTTLLNGGSIKALCQVLCNGKLRENTKEKLVVSLLQVSSDSPRISREIAGEGGLKSVLNSLLKMSDPCLKEEITSFIQEISTEKRTRDLFLSAGGIAVLHHLLDLYNSCSVIKNVCDTLRNIVFYSDVVRDSIDTEVIASLCNIINKIEDLTRAEHINKLPHILAVLSDLAKNQRNRYVMYENGGVEAACDILWSVRDDQVVRQTAMLLKVLGEDDEAKQMMIDQDLTPCLSGCIMSQDLSAQVKDELLPLMDMIDQYEIDQASSLAQNQNDLPQIELNIPKTHPKAQSKDSRETFPLNGGGDASHLLEDDFDDMPLLEEDELEIKQCHPKILWSQSANSVLLSVQLRDVKDPKVFITTSCISFSAILDSVEYVFELDLFSRVDSTNFTMVSAGREFLITLYKEGISIKWTRLTQTKEKIPYISVDFERWQDEDDMDLTSKKKPYSPKKVPYRLPEPGIEMSVNYHSASEDEDHSDVSGDEFDKAFETIPTASSRSDTDFGFSS